MGKIEPLNPKFRAGILGATGSVGQRFIALLQQHPWIEIVAVGASEKSVGLKFKDACNWRLADSVLPEEIGELVVCDASDERHFIESCDIVFSSLISNLAKNIESNLAAAGLAVFSNAAAHRYDNDVPILLPQINSEHIHIVKTQATYKNGGGFIITNSNCSSAGLCVALKPLDAAFNIESVILTTLQAVSGAGYPGLSWWDINNNVIPNVPGEEHKLEKEPKKILGSYVPGEDTIRTRNVQISAMTHRVPVLDGHLISVAIKFKDPIDKKKIVSQIEEVYEAFNTTVAQSQVASLPSMPRQIIKVFPKEDHPQPRLHIYEGGGMTVCVGRIRPCEILDVKMVILSHNTIVGAAGGSIANAELAILTSILR